MIKALIFDLDGTLLYTLDSIARTCNKVLRAHALPPVTHVQLKQFVGDGVIDLLKRAFAAGGSDEIPNDNTVKEFKQYFREDCNYHVAPYDGIPEVLEYCKTHGILLACNTNKPHENALKVIHTHFGDSFQAVQGNKEGIPKKPAADGVFQILQRLDVCASEAVYIGDSDVDVFTAKAARMRSFGAAWGYRGTEELMKSGADEILSHPIQIIDYIKL